MLQKELKYMYCNYQGIIEKVDSYFYFTPDKKES